MYATITWWCFCSFILFCCVWVCVCVSVCWWLLLSALYGKRRPTAALVLCNMPARHSFPCVWYMYGIVSILFAFICYLYERFWPLSRTAGFIFFSFTWFMMMYSRWNGRTIRLMNRGKELLVASTHFRHRHTRHREWTRIICTSPSSWIKRDGKGR